MNQINGDFQELLCVPDVLFHYLDRVVQRLLWRCYLRFHRLWTHEEHWGESKPSTADRQFLSIRNQQPRILEYLLWRRVTTPSHSLIQNIFRYSSFEERTWIISISPQREWCSDGSRHHMTLLTEALSPRPATRSIVNSLFLSSMNLTASLSIWNPFLPDLWVLDTSLPAIVIPLWSYEKLQECRASIGEG